VLSNDGTGVRQSCVCSSTSVKGDGCNIVQSGTDGKPSPDVPVPSREIDNKASITSGGSNSFQLKGSRLDSAQSILFKGDPVIVEIDRLDADGKSTPGPLAKGTFAEIKICSPRYDANSDPKLFLVEAKLKDSRTVCDEINAGATVPPKTFTAPNCWTFPVCHASTYGAGDASLSEASSAAVIAASVGTLAIGLFVL
jgi:hypothetical protein